MRKPTFLVLSSPRRSFSRIGLSFVALGVLATSVNCSEGDDPSDRTGADNASVRTCPCSIWSDSAEPRVAADSDSRAVELGVKFRSDNPGVITGIRFYKSVSNTGTHTGSLWSTDGVRLATATFSQETASGWQTVSFATPVAISANTVYVASYHTDTGHYASDERAFSRTGVDNAPLHALRSNTSGGNGVYRYGSSSFPTNSYRASNYWVDVVFTDNPSGVDAGTDSGGGGNDSGTAIDSGTGGGALALPRIPWEGGPAYWSRYPQATAVGWTRSDFFPIGVWFETLYNAAALKALGINTLVGANHDGASISLAQSAGVFVIAQDEWSRAEIGTSNQVVGWLASDEIDMNSSSPVSDQQAQVDKLRGFGDGRFVYSNYGKGMYGTWWNPDSLPALVQMVDVASDDLYFYSDPNAPGEAPASPYWPAGAVVRSSGSYGFTVNRMRSFLAPSQLHPTWNFVEDGHPWSEPDTEAPTMTPDHLEGAVWASVRHEARGILYFNHSFGGSCQSQHVLFDCNPDMKTRVQAVDGQIQALAPVLNTQSYQFTLSANADTMLKTYNGSAYVFAGIGQNQTAGTKTFTLPPGVRGTTVTVVGEGRTIPVVNGAFSDTFAFEYSHHTYQIAL